jgi:division protein CdvB (Snf7/Vps24/ESCRT-III family)
MRQAIFLLGFFLIGTQTFAQTNEKDGNAKKPSITKQEAKQLANDIQQALENVGSELENIDWKVISNTISKAIEQIDEHANAIGDIAKEIDQKKLEESLNRIADKVEQSVDLKKLEKQLQKLGADLEEKMETK